MTSEPLGGWQPTCVLNVIRTYGSSTEAAWVVTDAGEAFIKVMGNPEGDHVLACEWVGTRLAAWLGLPTFQTAIMNVSAAEAALFPPGRGQVRPGPAFISRMDVGGTWSGGSEVLKKLTNPQDVTRLVILDTWSRNCDRYSRRPDGGHRVNRNNVYLSDDAPAGTLLLRAMDHTHCFTCGREVLPKHLEIAHIQEESVYGLFPEFVPLRDRAAAEETCRRLARMDRATAEGIVGAVPVAWGVAPNGLAALSDFIVRRAAFLATRMVVMLWPNELPFPPAVSS